LTENTKSFEKYEKLVLQFVIGAFLVAYYWFVAYYEMNQIVDGVQNLNTASETTLIWFVVPFAAFTILSIATRLWRVQAAGHEKKR
jgi:ABC-type bacteriocin/lantibiotic exporter with double-glycine peptidase domain